METHLKKLGEIFNQGIFWGFVLPNSFLKIRPRGKRMHEIVLFLVKLLNCSF